MASEVRDDLHLTSTGKGHYYRSPHGFPPQGFRVSFSLIFLWWVFYIFSLNVISYHNHIVSWLESFFGLKSFMYDFTCKHLCLVMSIHFIPGLNLHVLWIYEIMSMIGRCITKINCLRSERFIRAVLGCMLPSLYIPIPYLTSPPPPPLQDLGSIVSPSSLSSIRFFYS